MWRGAAIAAFRDGICDAHWGIGADSPLQVPLRDEVAGFGLQIREGQWGDCFLGAHDAFHGEGVTHRLAVNLEHVVLQIQQPEFPHPLAGISRALVFAIIAHAGVGHFNDQEDEVW